MARTINQQISQLEAQLARLKDKERSLETGQKVILGGLLLNAAKRNPKMREWLLNEAAQHVSREVDQKRLAPLLDELKALPSAPKVP